MRIWLIVLSIIGAVAYLASGIGKIADPGQMAGLTGFSNGMVLLIAALEIAGAVGLLAGLVVRVLGALAAGGLVLLMIGAFIVNLSAGSPFAQTLLPIALGIVCGVILTLTVKLGITWKIQPRAARR